MTKRAFSSFQTAWARQQIRNDARRIRTKVKEARDSRDTASKRWPFELLQNAHDAGPREGRKGINVTFAYRDGVLTFEHDGRTFSTQELAALLSGGSSKDFDTVEQTGRFGTGFLATHVLATQLIVSGLLTESGQHEQFTLNLDRSGDDDDIVLNCEASQRQLEDAKEVTDIAGLPSALFSYTTDDPAVVEAGFVAVEAALPYVLMTCTHLETVTIERDAGTTRWTTDARRTDDSVEGCVVHEVDVVRDDPRGAAQLRAVGLTATTAEPMVIVILQNQAVSPSVVPPPDGLPRVFLRFPVPATGTFPLNVVIDASVDVRQERTDLLRNEKTNQAMAAGIALVPTLVRYAFSREWRDAHLLARVGRIPGEDSGGWMHEELSRAAQELARERLVRSGEALLPAVTDDGAWADFPLARLSDHSEHDDVSFSKVYKLMEGDERFDPPNYDVAEAWTSIAKGWADLGVQITFRTVHDILEEVRSGATVSSELKLRVDPIDWILQAAELVGEAWTNRGAGNADVLDGLIPNQQGALCEASALRLDSGISDGLKDIALRAGRDIRAELLDQRVSAAADTNQFVQKTLDEILGGSMNEEDVIVECLSAFRDALPADSETGDEDANVIGASLDFLGYLWDRAGKQVAEAEADDEDEQTNFTDTARECPFVARDGTCVYWSPKKVFIAPPPVWSESARPFVRVYPPGRVLADVYATAPVVLEALKNWGIAFLDPLIEVDTTELTGKRLVALAGDPHVDGVTVRDQRLSQIALLQPEVLEHCQEDPEDAAALLGLVLTDIARRDDGWLTRRTVTGRHSQQETDFEIFESLWLADLLSKAWVPWDTGEGVTKVIPQEAALLPLLRPEWLRDNPQAAAFLVSHFKFDPLNLQLHTAAQDEYTRAALKDQLAKLVALVGSDPAKYAELIRAITAANDVGAQVKRWRAFGFAVQDSVKKAIEALGFLVETIDRGYDFRVQILPITFDADGTPILEFKVGEHLVEVKATTEDEVRMTPLQVATAVGSPNMYSLCVVDLKGQAATPLELLTAERIAPLMRFVPTIGTIARDTVGLVAEAKTQAVPVRNDSALRYGVARPVWAKGQTLADWVKGLVSSPSA
jgi:hypothetical protein